MREKQRANFESSEMPPLFSTDKFTDKRMANGFKEESYVDSHHSPPDMRTSSNFDSAERRDTSKHFNHPTSSLSFGQQAVISVHAHRIIQSFSIPHHPLRSSSKNRDSPVSEALKKKDVPKRETIDGREFFKKAKSIMSYDDVRSRSN